jgi:hypothetical protein
MLFTKDTSKHWTDVNIPIKPHGIPALDREGLGHLTLTAIIRLETVFA